MQRLGKKKVYIIHHRRSPSPLVWLLVAAGVGYFLFKDKLFPQTAAPALPATPVPDPSYASTPDQGSGYTPDGKFYQYVHIAYNWTFTDGQGGAAISYTVLPTDSHVPKNWGTPMFDPWATDNITAAMPNPAVPVITYTAPTAQPTDSTYADKALINARQQYYNGIAYGDYDPSWIAAFQKMYYQTDINTAIAELKASGQYLSQFWSTQIPLTSATQPLYSQIEAIHSKYGIF